MFIKNKLTRKYISLPTPLNLATYKSYKNKYNYLFKASKKRFYNDLFPKSESNIKATWKIINQLLQRKKASSKFTSAFTDGSSKLPITNPFDITCKFNYFFTNVGASLANQIVHTNADPLDYIKDSFPFLSNFNLPDVKEVNDIIL